MRLRVMRERMRRLAPAVVLLSIPDACDGGKKPAETKAAAQRPALPTATGAVMLDARSPSESDLMMANEAAVITSAPFLSALANARTRRSLPRQSARRDVPARRYRRLRDRR